MKRENLVLLSLAGLILMGSSSCVGTHGAIKHYSYPYSKAAVEKAINALYVMDSAVRVPLSKPDWQPHSPFFTFCLKDSIPLLYKIRFYGDDKEWNRQPHYAQFFIIYVKEGEEPAKSASTMRKEEVEWYASIFEQKIKGKLDVLLKGSGSQQFRP